MKVIITILSLFWLQVSAGTFYCTTPGELRTRLNAAVPGDNILLLRGVTFTGSFTINKGGSSAAPVTIGSYGVMSAPIIEGTTTQGLIIVNAPYVVIDGLNITDPLMNEADHYAQARAHTAIQVSANYVTVKNCSISLVGCGINQQGSYCLVQGNEIFNLRMIKNTPTTQNSDDDYGASPIIISGHHNKILANKLRDGWAYSYDYGYDGCGVEFYGDNSGDNTIMYNTAIDCNGFNEFGSNAGGNSNNNLVAYNLIINCGDLVYTNNSGQYAISVNNLQYYNNIILETKMQFTKVQQMVIIGSNSQVSMKNNIFYLMTGVDVATGSVFSQAKNIHENNVYRLGTGSVLNFPAGTSEKITTQNLFTNISGDAAGWNYQPLATSPARNAGQWVGINRDMINTPVATIPCAGAYEYLSTTNLPTTPEPLPNSPAPFIWNSSSIIVINSRRMHNWTFYDIIGRVLSRGTYRPGRTMIDISRYPAGIYLLQTEFKTYKIVK